VPYDYPGAPDLAELVAGVARDRGLPVVNVTVGSMPLHYPTLNLVEHLRTAERVLSVGVLQTGGPVHFLAFGACIAAAAAGSGHRVAVLGSGGMSHRFWPIDEQRGRVAFDPGNVISDAARRWDRRILDHWADGDHAAVVDLWPDYRAVEPEGRFAHYLTLLGAIGGPSCRAPGRPVSQYENALGTGQVHVVFDLAGGGTAADCAPTGEAGRR
jgi:aromatic ring-opening dioxygenase catalytic subunit (LigB family)